VSIDSRTTSPGDLFIALSGDPGPRFGGARGNTLDGHDFVKQAAEKGAAVVMAHRPVDVDVPLIIVEDTLDGLWQLGAAARSRCQAKTIAITGSGGKTTMRFWLETLLSSIGRMHASTGSLNNHWGVPLSLARMPVDTEYGVFEVGTSGEGEIAPLSELVSPHIALLLNVLPAHIGNFPDMDALIEEKLSIARGLVPTGTLILPFALNSRSAFPHRRSFGLAPEADVTARMVDEEDPLLAEVNLGGRSLRCRLPFAGDERLESVLAVLAVLSELEVDIERVLPEIEQLELPTGRGNVIHRNGMTVIDDSYNANEVSMTMAIDALRAYPTGGRRIALLGEMLELGDRSQSAHDSVATTAEGLDHVVTFGGEFQSQAALHGWTHHESAADFDCQVFADSLQPGDVVLVKGSNRVFWVNGFVNDLVKAIDR
jgi:UDP-N-acetylmuramoyl-tripeptide--D-alanyl-D-alanine ligase